MRKYEFYEDGIWLRTEREVGKEKARTMKRVLLERDEFDTYGEDRMGGSTRGWFDMISTKDLRKKKVRKDLMRLGYIW